MGQLQGKTALITGGGAGIGAAIGTLFAAEGAKVALADIDFDAAMAVTKSIGDAALGLKLDVTKESQWIEAIAKTQETLGDVSIVVNNAGISEPGTVEDETLAHWHKIHSINLDGTFLGSKHGIAAIKQARQPGSIINIGSMVALRPGAAFAAYGSSKAAVTMMTKSMALHCTDQGYPIRCNVIHPGAIETPMFERYLEMTGLPHDEAYQEFAKHHPIGRVGKAQEVAKAALFLASDASSFTTGADIMVDGGGVIRA